MLIKLPVVYSEESQQEEFQDDYHVNPRYIISVRANGDDESWVNVLDVGELHVCMHVQHVLDLVRGAV